VVPGYLSDPARFDQAAAAVAQTETPVASPVPVGPPRPARPAVPGPGPRRGGRCEWVGGRHLWIHWRGGAPAWRLLLVEEPPRL